MELWLALVLILVALFGGFIGGFFMSRRYMMNYFKENPPIDERMIAAMMAQMGQKPSAKKVKQIMNSMKQR